MKLRNAVLCGWDVWQWPMNGVGTFKGNVQRLKDLGTLIRYGFSIGRMSTRVTKMNVDEMVTKWVDAVVGMSTAHDKDTFDKHDAKADELMGPILTAPIKQVREFYTKLQKEMKLNPKVPMLVWMGFEAWGETVVKDAEDDKTFLRLKDKLAAEIAEIVEMDIQDQIPEALKRALRWRDPETLEKVKETLTKEKEKGNKPRLVGRQSCLFLETGQGDEKVQVML